MNVQEQIDAAWDKVRPWSKPTSPPSMEFVDGFLAGMKTGEAAEREACAKTCEALWQEEATAAVNGTQEPKYHDAIECAYAIRERSNVLGQGRAADRRSVPCNEMLGGGLAPIGVRTSQGSPLPDLPL